MKKTTILSGLLLLVGLTAQAQDRVTEYNVRPAVTLRTPLQGDSLNFIGEKFTISNLLNTNINLDFEGHLYECMPVDTAGYVAVQKADKDNLLYHRLLRLKGIRKGKLFFSSFHFLFF